MCYLKKWKENFPNTLQQQKREEKNPQKVPVNLMTGNKNTDDRNLIEW